MNKYGGINDYPECDKKVYKLWYQMLRRCFDSSQHERNKGKSYKECTVCNEWMMLSAFSRDVKQIAGYEEWMTHKGYCLDKDTINPNNKIYCKEFCCFITAADNIRDIHNRKPQNIEKLHELRKSKYMLIKNDEVLIFNSEKEACEYVGVVKCSISSCYRRNRKCKGYRIEKMDGGEGK